jgi:hypothetical protein
MNELLSRALEKIAAKGEKNFDRMHKTTVWNCYGF